MPIKTGTSNMTNHRFLLNSMPVASAYWNTLRAAALAANVQANRRCELARHASSLGELARHASSLGGPPASN
jgi:hypothetical protein